uniref:ARAD1B19096p n=1 Tax=Blastobotrys adeninivorans TaxID=409370 RepID=A0A060T6J3_BLAAD
MSEVRKRRNTNPRQPDPTDDGASLEAMLLHKLDVFLYKVESRLNDMEEYGLQKLIQFDQSIQHAYDVLSQAREEMIGAGKRRADVLLRFMENKLYMDPIDGDGSGSSDRAESSGVSYQAVSESVSGSVSEVSDKLAKALLLMEEKLAYIEATCFEVVDSKAAVIGAQLALQAAASRLLTYDELPIQWRDNPYIVRGYRFCKGYMDCVYSLVRVHNETCNIWTHLLGFFVMLGLAFYHWPSTLSWEQSSTMDKVTMIIFLVAAMKCLVCSAVWHTFSGISRLKIKQKFACVDYTGITVLIAASILTTEYTALYCRPMERNIYMAVTAMFGLFGSIFTWLPVFDTKEYRGKRILFFVSFAVAGILGFIHTALLHGFVDTFSFYLPVLKSLLCYVAGVVVYSFHIPERWFPGWVFDYFGMSHNLWHISVFGGIYYHYIATVRLMENARTFSCSY